MDLRYAKTEDFLDVAHTLLRRSEFRVTDADVESLSETLAESARSWFGDTKHLTPKFPRASRPDASFVPKR